MRHKLLKLLSFLLVITIAIAITIFYSIYIAPENIGITHKNIKSNKITKSLQDINIAFISDFHYGEFVDKSRFEATIHKINTVSADIVLFGGDLFSDATQYIDKPDIIKEITDALSSIEAPLGKFYVLGECDLKNEESKQLVNKILYDAGFENVSNRNLRLHNGNQESFNLVGIDSLIGGSPDMNTAYAGISNTNFTIAFSHAPDVFATIPKNSTDLALAGHSHGGQLALPIIGSLKAIDGARIYERGTYQVDTATLAISNGLGTTKVDMRLFSRPEIVVYRLTK